MRVLPFLRLAPIVALALMSDSALAAWPPGGLLLGSMGRGNRLHAPDHRTIAESGGSCLVLFLGYDAGPVLRLGPSGGKAQVWPVAGLYPGTPGAQAYLVDAIPVGGGALVVWGDYRPSSGPYGRLYAQRLTAAGTLAPGWPDSGVALSAAGAIISATRMAPDGSGGAFIAWNDGDYASNRVFFQRVTTDGIAVSPGGVPAGTGSGAQHLHALTADGTGGAIAAWEDERDYAASAYNTDIYAQRVNAALSLQWNAAGVGVCRAPYWQLSPVAMPDGQGGAFVAWEDARYVYASAPESDVFAQRLTPAGAPASGWEVDGALVTEDRWLSDIHLASDAVGGALVSSVLVPLGPPQVRVDRIGPSGAVTNGWLPELYATVAPYTANNRHPHDMISDGAGGAYLSWATDDGTFALHVGSDGEPAPGWSVGPVRLDFGDPGSSTRTTLAPDGSGGAFALFEKRVNDYIPHEVSYEKFLYAARLTPDGVLAAPASKPDARISLAGSRPNPSAGAPAIAFSLAGSDAATLELIDLQGRRIETREVGSLGAGPHLLRLGEGRALAPGVYLVRLRAGARSLTTRACIIR